MQGAGIQDEERQPLPTRSYRGDSARCKQRQTVNHLLISRERDAGADNLKGPLQMKAIKRKSMRGFCALGNGEMAAGECNWVQFFWISSLAYVSSYKKKELEQRHSLFHSLHPAIECWMQL